MTSSPQIEKVFQCFVCFLVPFAPRPPPPSSAEPWPPLPTSYVVPTVARAVTHRIAQNKPLYAPLAEIDPEVQNIIDKETWRQYSGLELIASEVRRYAVGPFLS